jgi:hypothetical protein
MNSPFLIVGLHARQSSGCVGRPRRKDARNLSK